MDTVGSFGVVVSDERGTPVQVRVFPHGDAMVLRADQIVSVEPLGKYHRSLDSVVLQCKPKELKWAV